MNFNYEKLIPKGFLVNGIHCGIKKDKKNDLSIFYSTRDCVSAGVFTKNIVKSGSLIICMKHIKNKTSRVIIANSGCANTSTGKKGIEDAERMCELVAKFLNLESKNDVLVASTGVIGKYLNMEIVKNGIEKLCESISRGNISVISAEEGIMTTDTVPKIEGEHLKISGKEVKIIAFAKGSGMIHPDMATFLGFILTDCSITKNMLQKAVKAVVNKTLNCLSIDGVTSTNDTFIALANGMAGNSCISEEGEDFEKFVYALEKICKRISMRIVQDGEGATKVLKIEVRNARTFFEAKRIAEKIAVSPLVKTAVFGGDPNWGRVITSVGSSGIRVNPSKIDIFFENLCVCKNGTAVDIDDKKVRKIFLKPEINLKVNLNSGKENCYYLTCDLSYNYVKINSHYMT